MQQLLIALLDKEVFGKYGEIARSQFKTEEQLEIYRAIEVLHEQTEEDLTVDGLRLGLSTVYPVKKADHLAAMVKAWEGTVVDTALTASYFADAVKKAKAYEIATKAIQVFEGKADWGELNELFTEDLQEVSPEYDFVSNNLAVLQERQVATGGFKWRLNALNKLLGHLPRKRAGFLFARPETGKTLLLASEVTNFALQTDEPVIWIANEEDADTVMIRCYCALFGVNEARLFSNLGRYQAEFNKQIGERLIITGDTTVNNKLSLQRLFKQKQPSIVVIDQLDNVSGFKADREDLRCGAVYRWFRNQAISHNFTGIGVTQAGSSGEGKKWLGFGDIAEAKTTKPAAADWVLGIGKEKDNDAERFLSVLKDKLPISEGKDQKKRLGYTSVGIDLETSRYVDYAG